MTKILLRKQLAEIFRTYLYDAKSQKARSSRILSSSPC